MAEAFVTLVGVDRMEKTLKLMAQTNVKILKGLFYEDLHALEDMAVLAKQNFYSDIRWPAMKGIRPGQRMTGRFTFGGDAASIRGHFLHIPKVQYGWSYPNVERADAMTDYVWRALEFGLPGRGFPGSGEPFAPEGFHRIPHFRSAEAGTILYPVTRAKYLGKGFAGKHFLEDAFNVVGPDMTNRYRKRFRDELKDFIA